MVHFTCLVPNILAAILDDDLPDHIKFELGVDLYVLWDLQRMNCTLVDSDSI
ncbi:hypothetical protein [Methylomicrobium sp. Wu6]|uniref:hypothetical protein n=1 Tax=Methylomicrobium sp. Wu6 TaxID=3107928 RepID=UPI002DD6B873|nr:hypothetical protein [Methylomicrobium sp. Wu6]MEC4749879.1 hypothetical protein [Methylomicrobium sp. Wu6]